VPDHLTSGAVTLEREGERLASEAGALREAMANAAMAAGNGLAEGAIHDTLQAWLHVLDRLGSGLDDDAQKLRSCAAIYRQTDGRASTAADRVMHELPP
jgi:hypothetical protein